jgi:Glycosyl hydrolase 108
MKANRDQAIGYLVVSEGVEVTRRPGEPGGISKMGVSLTAYQDFCRAMGRPAPTTDTIADLTLDEAAEFYTLVTMPGIRFDDLPGGLDYKALDIAANLGPTGGLNALIAAVYAENMIWPLPTSMTDALIKSSFTTPVTSILSLGGIWIGQKMKSPEWSVDGHGWLNRNTLANTQALKMVGV